MTAIFQTINHCQKYQNSFVLGFSKPMAIFKPNACLQKLQKKMYSAILGTLNFLKLCIDLLFLGFVDVWLKGGVRILLMPFCIQFFIHFLMKGSWQFTFKDLTKICNLQKKVAVRTVISPLFLPKWNSSVLHSFSPNFCGLTSKL